MYAYWKNKKIGGEVNPQAQQADSHFTGGLFEISIALWSFYNPGQPSEKSAHQIKILSDHYFKQSLDIFHICTISSSES